MRDPFNTSEPRKRPTDGISFAKIRRQQGKKNRVDNPPAAPRDALGQALMKLDDERLKRLAGRELGTAKSQLRLIHGVNGTDAEVHAIARKAEDLEVIGLGDVFHPQALIRLLKTIDGLIKLDPRKTISFDTTVKTDGKLQPEEVSNAFKEITDIWTAKNRFVGERELLQEIALKYHPSTKPELFETRLSPHQLTGLPSKFKTPIGVALAHAYAINRQKPMSMIFGDVGNVGGTNKLFKRFLFGDIAQNGGQFTDEIWTRLGFTPKELRRLETEIKDIMGSKRSEKAKLSLLEQHTAVIRDKAANRLTDWVVRELMHEVQTVFQTSFASLYSDKGESEQIQLMGEGGDESYFTIPETTANVTAVMKEVNARVRKKIKDLDLQFHAHGKAGKPHGFGLSFFIRSLNESELKLADLTVKETVEKVTTESDFDQKNVHAADASRLYQLMSKLNNELKPNLAPTISNHAVLGEFDPGRQTSDYLIEYQLNSVFNHASGIPDISALPESYDPLRHTNILAINLMNIPAINDNLGQEIADEYQRKFTQSLREIPGLETAPRYSAGPGKFYLLVDSSINTEEIETQVATFVKDLNDSKAGDNQKIGDLANSENPNFKGLNFVIVNPGINKDDLAASIQEAKQMLQKKTGKLIGRVLILDAGGSAHKPMHKIKPDQ